VRCDEERFITEVCEDHRAAPEVDARIARAIAGLFGNRLIVDEEGIEAKVTKVQDNFGLEDSYLLSHHKLQRWKVFNFFFLSFPTLGCYEGGIRHRYNLGGRDQRGTQATEALLITIHNGRAEKGHERVSGRGQGLGHCVLSMLTGSVERQCGGKQSSITVTGSSRGASIELALHSTLSRSYM